LVRDDEETERRMEKEVLVKTNISVTKRIVVNGREYERPEVMPDELRNAYESAMENLRSGRTEFNLQGFRPKIVFNGREYATEEEMPQEERLLYKIAIDGLKTGKGSDAHLCAAPIEPVNHVVESPRSTLMYVVCGAILALLLFFYLLTYG
jgi:hypothetical protein